MHIFAFFWVISSNIFKSLTSGLFGLFLYGAEMDMNFILWMVWKWAIYLPLIFAQLMNYHSFMRLLQPACFALVILLVITMIHSWSDLSDQEWWKKSAKIRLIWVHSILISFLLKSFGECYVLYEDILYVMTTLQLDQLWIW